MTSRITAALISTASIAALTTGLVTAPVALAAPDPTTGVELNHPTSQFVATEVTVDFADSRTEGIKALKEYRSRAWDLNLPFDGSPIRQQAAKVGLTSKSGYVNAVQSDGGLTRIAVQRAAENSYTGGITHTRPYNNSCELGSAKECGNSFSAKYKGQQGWSENLAKQPANVGIGSMIIEQWGKGEEDALKASNGHWNVRDGHLHQLINPKFRYYGFGYVRGTDNAYTGASTASGSSIEADNLPAGRQTVTLYRAATPGERPTGIVTNTKPSTDKPKPADPTTNKPKPADPSTSKPQPSEPNEPEQKTPGQQGAAASIDFNNISSNSDILSSETATDGEKAAAGIALAVGILGLLGLLANLAQQAGVIRF
ncbi:MAG: CAP domain-containing protein [Corynebacterium pyruviciproducens]|uniref:CAP domain-containing protein n=1 Tax=Corynebacterium pyruviciproducens TaxID=598660 RepID=UPI003982F650